MYIKSPEVCAKRGRWGYTFTDTAAHVSYKYEKKPRLVTFQPEFSKAADRQQELLKLAAPLLSREPWPAAATLGCAPNCRLRAVPRSSFKILRLLSPVYKAVCPPARLTEHTPLQYYLEKNFAL